MRDGFDADHGVDPRSAWKTGAIHHEKVVHFPRFAVGVGGGSFGRTAEAGRPHDVEGKKREPAGLPACGIHSLGERIYRAAAAWFVSAPFCVRRKNMAGAGGFKDARRGDKSLPQVRAVEWRKSIVRDGVALLISRYTSAVLIADKNADSDGIRKLLEKRAVLLWIAPR